MDKLFEELERDAEATAKATPSDGDLKRAADLAARQVSLAQDIESTEELLAGLKREHEEVSTRLLPDLLLGLGLSEIRLATGGRLKVEKQVYASIKGEARPAAIAWLETHKFGDLVKYKVEVDVGKGKSAERDMVVESMTKLGYLTRDKTDVHPQTLKAFVAEQLEAGTDLPQDLFGVFVKNVCKIV